MVRKKCTCGAPLAGEVFPRLRMQYPAVFEEIRTLCPVCEEAKVLRSTARLAAFRNSAYASAYAVRGC